MGRMMAGKLKGKTSLITGVASGFGRGIAIRFAEEEANIILVDIDTKGMSETERMIRAVNSEVKIYSKHLDISSFEQVNQVVSDILHEGVEINILVNNAGWSHPNQPLLEVDQNTLQKVFAINVFSIFNFTQAIVPHWRTIGGGVMLNTSSTAGSRPRPGLTWYNATKGAVNTLTKSLAVELAPDKIRVCGIAPVIGNTGLTETFMGVPNTPENRDKFLKTIPLGRYCEAKDVADAALFLVSDQADFITGAILEVDGGRCI